MNRHKSRWVVLTRIPTLGCVLVMSVAPSLGAGDRSIAAADDPGLQAVYKYVLYQSPDLAQDEREAIVRESAVKEVHGWPLQDRLVHHRLMSFPKGSSLRQGALLVAVDDRLLVTRIKEPRDLNEVLRKEGLAIRSTEEAERVVHLFFKCSRVGSVLYFGWEYGLNIVRSNDDIRFVSDEERNTIASEFPISPPTIKKEGDAYRYVLFSWDNEGRGLLERYEVLLDSRGIVEINRKHYPRHVGVWNPDR